MKISILKLPSGEKDLEIDGNFTITIRQDNGGFFITLDKSIWDEGLKSYVHNCAGVWCSEKAWNKLMKAAESGRKLLDVKLSEPKPNKQFHYINEPQC